MPWEKSVLKLSAQEERLKVIQMFIANPSPEQRYIFQ